jgi:4,5-DOPA dioxygenase extradiol
MHRHEAATLDYVPRFAGWLQDALASGDRERLVAWRDLAPDAARAHPTEEHFLPLFFALGAAGQGATAERVYSSVEGAALSMDAYRFN